MCLIATVVLSVTVARADQIAQGLVFHDANGNGLYDQGEPPIADVMVSNGRDITRTGADGRYSIPVDDDSFVFVIKPRGYRTAVDSLNLPRFYYRHNPGGSPDDGFLYAGVEPTGDLPASIDFPLYPQTERPGFDVIILGDTQPYNLAQLDYMARDVLPGLMRATMDTDTPPAFVISLGDLVGDDLTLYEPLNRVLSLLGVPIYNVLGNHDQNYLSPDDDHADETFERVFGPTTYAFQYADVHFVILDNVNWQGFDGLGDNGKPKTRHYFGGMDPDDLAFVTKYLNIIPNDALVVMCMHIPLDGQSRFVQMREKAELLGALSTHPRSLTISGHTHIQRNWFFGGAHGYHPSEPNQFGTQEHHHFNAATASGSWYNGAPDEFGLPHTTMRDGAPNGFNIASFDGDEYSIRFYPARYPESFQMSIFAPSAVTIGERAEVVVNVFAGGPLSKVEMRVGRMTGAGHKWTDWKTMSFRVRPDPFYLAVKESETADAPPNGSTMPDVIDSHHIWVGPLPDDLPAGVHVIEAKTIDMYGQEDVGRRVIRVDQ